MPAAALTALAREEDRQQSLDAGFQLHLAKPIDSAALDCRGRQPQVTDFQSFPGS